jgi:hypothetical protein
LAAQFNSRDGDYLGEVAALNEDDHHEFYLDLGNFLALGETRVTISVDDIQEVQANYLVLRLTESEARDLPPAERRGEEL